MLHRPQITADVNADEAPATVSGQAIPARSGCRWREQPRGAERWLVTDWAAGDVIGVDRRAAVCPGAACAVVRQLLRQAIEIRPFG